MLPEVKKPKVLLFDLGGVIVRWTGIEELSKLSGLSNDQVRAVLANSEICIRHESGLCSDDIFLNELIDIFGLELNQDQMKISWNQWVGQVYQGTIQALSTLKQKYCVACLSNTNSLHWSHLNAYFDCAKYFDPAIASHEINLAKPSIECFEYVIGRLGVTAPEIIFFDDSKANIEAALSLGIQAIQINPETGVVPVLEKLNLLSPN